MAVTVGTKTAPAQANHEATTTDAIMGLVFDRNTNVPIANARVVLTPMGDSLRPRTGITDSRGNYRLPEIPFGQYAFAVKRLGYEEVVLDIMVDRSEALSVSIGLNPAPLTLPPVTVETNTDEVRNRITAAAPSVSSRRNTIDAAEIEQRSLTNQTALQILRRLRPGWLSTRGDVGTAGIRGNNQIVLYIDGVRRGVVDDAQTIDGGTVARIYLFEAIEATQQWGTGHVNGAINILLRPVRE